MLVIVALDRDGLEKMYIHSSWVHQDRSLSNHFACSMKEDWNYRHAGGNGEHERAFLEWAQGIVVSASAFGENDDAVSIANLFCCIIIRGKCGLSILPLNWNHSGSFHGCAKNRNFEQLGLGNEFRAMKNRCERRDVIPADVIRHENVCLAYLCPL